MNKGAALNENTEKIDVGFCINWGTLCVYTLYWIYLLVDVLYNRRTGPAFLLILPPFWTCTSDFFYRWFSFSINKQFVSLFI